MSDYIPDEVLIEILARLPVKSLLQFRSVCKSWNSLIANPSFITAHLNRTKSNTTLPQLLIIKYTSHIQNQEHCISCSDDQTFCDEFVDLENPFHRSGKSFKIVGSCNGLLCLSDYDGSGCALLWNPSIRRFLTLPESGYSISDSNLRFVFGFGFDHRCNDYKVLKIGYLNDFKTGGSVLCKVELYTLSTHSWRPVCVVDFKFEFFINTSSAFVNGAVHWVAFDPAKKRGSAILIVAFDMGNEVFREISLPNYQTNGRLHTSTAVAVLGESLAVIDFESDLVPTDLICNFHIWVMEEYGVIESWTKRYTVIGQHIFSNVLGFRRNGDVLIIQGGLPGELVSYDPQSHQIKYHGVYGNSFYLYTYIESLVALDAADGVWKSHGHPSSPNIVANKGA
ncbi:unnamed protein product [Camellia sinensis]